MVACHLWSCQLWAAHIVSQRWKTSRSLKGNVHPDSKQIKINLIRLHLRLTFKVLHYKLSHWVWDILSVRAGGYERNKWGRGGQGLHCLMSLGSVWLIVKRSAADIPRMFHESTHPPFRPKGSQWHRCACGSYGIPEVPLKFYISCWGVNHGRMHVWERAGAATRESWCELHMS